MRHWIGGLVVVTTVLAGGVRGETPVIASADDAEGDHAVIDALVEQLGSDTWQQRQAAQDQLVALGAAATGRLRAHLEAAQDPEIRGALETVLADLWLHEVTGQTLVTLQLHDAAPREAFTELMRQARAPLRVLPATLWDSRQVGITIDRAGEPFWEVCRELAQRTGITVRDQRAPGELVFSSGSPDRLFGPTVHSGPFMIVAASADQRATLDYGGQRPGTQTLSITLRVFAEPKLRIFGRTPGAVVEEAIDENGHSMLAPDPSAATGLSAVGSQAFPLVVRLAPVSPGGKSIARLKGHFEVAAQLRSATLEVENLADARNLATSVGHHRVMITTEAKSPVEHEVRLSVFRDGSYERYWDRALDGRSVELYDADGKLLSANRTMSRSGQQAETRFRVKLAATNEGLGPPARLVWTVPVEMREMTVPFEFRDLPLP